MNQRGTVLLIVLLVAAVIGGYFIYTNYSNNRTKTAQNSTAISQTSQATDSTRVIYNLGNFTLAIPNSDIAKSENDFYGKVSTTKISKTSENPCPVYVSGINTLYLEKTYPVSPKDISKPIISVSEWDTDNLKFDNEETKQNFLKQVETLNKLSNFQGTPNDDQTPPRLNFSWVESCAGIYSILFSARKVETSKFSSVYFAEVSEGNGDVTDYPMRTLIVHQKNSWIIIKDQQRLLERNERYAVIAWAGSGCESRERECQKDFWAKKLKNRSEDEKWIQRMLDSITYKQ